MNKRNRRVLAGVLIIIGLLMFVLAPESLGGVILILGGVLVEVLAFTLERRGKDN